MSDGDGAKANPFEGVGDPLAVVLGFRRSPAMQVVYEGPDHRVVAVNDVTGAFFGDRSGLGLPLREAFGDVMGQGWGDVVETVFRTGEPFVAREWRIDVSRPDGSTQVSFVSASFDRWEADGRSGVLGFASDVTEEVLSRQEAEAAGAAPEQRYQEVRDLARILQDSLLPGTLPVVAGLQTAGSYLLALDDTAAGGDWLDVVPTEQGRVALVVGDVVGHGVGASALMGQLRAVLGERLASGAGIVDSLTALDRMARRTPEARAATVVVVELDPASGRLRYCTAGHPPPLVVSGGEARFLEPTGSRPLATDGGFRVAEERLGLGDQLLLYSDGLVERPGRTPAQATVELATVAGRVARGEAFGVPDLGPADRMCAQVLELLTRETGHADDITVLAAQRVVAPSSLGLTTRAGLAALQEVRQAVTAWLAALAVRPLDEMALQHALGECVTNVIDHAYRDRADGHDQPLRVTAALDRPGAATVRVADDGAWRYGQREAERGRGLQMANHITDRLTIDRSDAGTTVTLTCPLSRSVALMEGASTTDHVPHEETFAVEQTDGLLAVRGPVDMLSVDDFRIELLRLVSGRLPAARVDLSRVTLLASCGVQALYDALERAEEQGISLLLVAQPGSVAQHVLDLVGLPYAAPDAPDDPAT